MRRRGTPSAAPGYRSFLEEVAGRDADQQQDRADDRRRAEDLHGLALLLDRLDRIVDGAGADEVDALDLGHVDRHHRRAPSANSVSFATCAGCEPAHHAGPREHFGGRVGVVGNGLAGRWRAAAPVVRGRCAASPARSPAVPTTAATPRTSPHNRRRGRRRRRDRSATAGARATAATRLRRRSRPRLTAASSARRRFSGRCRRSGYLPAARFAQHVGQQPRAGVVEFGDRREVETRLRRIAARSRASALRAASRSPRVSLPVTLM